MRLRSRSMAAVSLVPAAMKLAASADRLLSAVDAVLNAQGGALTAAVEKLRVVRAGMLAHDQTRPKRTPAK
jgi:hypothetical protein